MQETREHKKIEINSRFEQAISLLEDSSKHVFVTGNAGTGKSTLLEYFQKTTTKKCAVLAPTGVAALNVQGQTIHSFFRIPPNITPDQVTEHKLSKKRQELLNQLEMIVIDEVSMLRADLLDCIDVSLRYYRQDSRPFGGVQMIFIGDLYQLPPVVAGPEEKEIFRNHYSSPYFFSAKVLQEISFSFLELKKIYRQKDDAFIELLNKVRNNTVSWKDLEILNEQHNPYPEDNQSKEFIITLTTTNAAANKKNSEELQKITSKTHNLNGELTGDFPTRNLPTHMELEVKVGAQIMLLNNDPAGRWVNGSIGKVTNIAFDETEMDDLLTIELNTGDSVKVKRHTWNIHKYFFNEETQKIDTEVVGSFSQFPLRLAWAVTIHKSQGKTFDKVIIDIGRGTFAHGQIYVALSRSTSLSGITLKVPIKKRHIWLDRKVQEFFHYIGQTT